MALAHQIKFSEAKQKSAEPKAARVQRTAAPSTKEAAAAGNPPLSAASAKRGLVGPKATFLVTVPGTMIKRLETGRAAGGFRSRNDYVVSLLEAGAPK